MEHLWILFFLFVFSFSFLHLILSIEVFHFATKSSHLKVSMYYASALRNWGAIENDNQKTVAKNQILLKFNNQMKKSTF